MLVVQFGLAYYARAVLAGAAEDGAVVASRRGASAADGKAIADQLLDRAGSSIIVDHEVTVSVTDDQVVVIASGAVVSLVPFIGDTVAIDVEAVAPREVFQGQG